MFLADFFCRGNLSLYKLLTYLLLDIADLELLTAVDDADARAFLAGTTCTTRAMGVILDIVRQPEVDDMRQVIHVETTCRHIRCHQQLRQVLTELLHRKVTLLLTQITMQRLSIITIPNQFIGYLLCLYLRPTEDDGKDLGIVIHDTFQSEVLVFGVHQIIDMVHVLCTLVATTYYDLLIVVKILLCDTLHLTAHGGREHQGAVFSRQ